MNIAEEQAILEVVVSAMEHEAETQDLMEAERVTPEMYAASLRRMAANVRSRLLPG
jgi:hypothetical protein